MPKQGTSTSQEESSSETTKFQSIQPLKQQFLPTTGEPPLKWEVWIKMFND